MDSESGSMSPGRLRHGFWWLPVLALLLTGGWLASADDPAAGEVQATIQAA